MPYLIVIQDPATPVPHKTTHLSFDAANEYLEIVSQTTLVDYWKDAYDTVTNLENLRRAIDAGFPKSVIDEFGRCITITQVGEVLTA